jgi:hypothetical protein
MPSEPVGGVPAVVADNPWFGDTLRRLSASAGSEIQLFCSAEEEPKAQALMLVVRLMLDIQTPVLARLDENGSRQPHSRASASSLPQAGFMTLCDTSPCIRRVCGFSPTGRLTPQDYVTSRGPYRDTPCTPTNMNLNRDG